MKLRIVELGIQHAVAIWIVGNLYFPFQKRDFRAFRLESKKETRNNEEKNGETNIKSFQRLRTVIQQSGNRNNGSEVWQRIKERRKCAAADGRPVT